uniref:Uncharacterized protein n=1 Tax=Anguilla anguilla TaxID=7936 RepID=A0A0E9TYK3_ANGAN
MCPVTTVLRPHPFLFYFSVLKSFVVCLIEYKTSSVWCVRITYAFKLAKCV